MNRSTPSANDILRGNTGLATQQSTRGGSELAIQNMLKAEVPRIQRLFADPKMTTRFVQLAMMDMRKVPKLLQCNPQSILGCMMQAASLGLYFGMNGQCYMVPYAGEATFVTGWRGHVTLAMRGAIGSVIRTGAVHPGDEFDYEQGSRAFVHYKSTGDRFAPATHFFAESVPPGATNGQVEVWKRSDIEKHRDRFNKVGSKHYSFNNEESFEGYGRKVPLLQAIKYLPVSYESAIATELDYAADRGAQAMRPEMIEAGSVGISAPEANPFDDLFDILDWSQDERQTFLSTHSSQTEEAIRAELSAAIDERNV